MKYILSTICEALIRQLLIGMSDIFQINLIDYITRYILFDREKEYEYSLEICDSPI